MKTYIQKKLRFLIVMILKHLNVDSFTVRRYDLIKNGKKDVYKPCSFPIFSQCHTGQSHNVMIKLYREKIYA